MVFRYEVLCANLAVEKPKWSYLLHYSHEVACSDEPSLHRTLYSLRGCFNLPILQGVLSTKHVCERCFFFSFIAWIITDACVVSRMYHMFYSLCMYFMWYACLSQSTWCEYALQLNINVLYFLCMNDACTCPWQSRTKQVSISSTSPGPQTYLAQVFSRWNPSGSIVMFNKETYM